MRGKQSRLIRQVFGSVIIAVVAGGGLTSCASHSVNSVASPLIGPDIAPDSSVVIIRVTNYDWDDVVVVVDAGHTLRRVGTVAGMRWSLLVLTSAALGPIREFTVLVVPVRQPVRTYETRRITRAAGKLVFVTIAMGDEPQHTTYPTRAAVFDLP